MNTNDIIMKMVAVGLPFLALVGWLGYSIINAS